MDDEIQGYCFGHGFVQSKNVARVISRFDELASYGSAASSLMMWSGRTRRWHHFNVGWTAVRLACSGNGMFALGANGQFLKADSAGVSEEAIPDFAPGAEGCALNDMCLVGDCVYVCGEKSALYRRDGAGQWTKARLGGADDDPGGRANLYAVHGLSGADVFAVGERGAIWRMKDGEWTRIKSPTQNTLHNVRVADDGSAFAVGAGGTILKGHGADWKVVSASAPKDLWGLEIFNGRVFVASEDAVSVLGEDEKGLLGLRIGYGPFGTFKHLHANDGVLWSFGHKNIYWTADGEVWTEITPSFTVFDPSETGPAPSQSGCGCTGGAHECG